MRIHRPLAAALVLLALAGCDRPPAKEYDYPAWGFAATFKTPPRVKESPAKADGTPRGFTVIEDEGADDFSIYVGEVGPTPKTIDQVADIGAPILAKAVGGDVGSRTSVATAPTETQAIGRKVSITRNGQPFLELRIFLVNGRYYQVAGRTSSGPQDPDAQAFLDSFHIIPAPPVAANAPR